MIAFSAIRLINDDILFLVIVRTMYVWIILSTPLLNAASHPLKRVNESDLNQ